LVLVIYMYIVLKRIHDMDYIEDLQKSPELIISNIVCYHCGCKITHKICRNELFIDKTNIKIVFCCSSCQNILTSSFKTAII
jgi:hypothetical protein